jgi:hypothetical protein
MDYFPVDFSKEIDIEKLIGFSHSTFPKVECIPK